MSTIVQSLTGLPTLEVAIAGKLKEGLQLAAKQRFDLVLLDHLLPDGAGLDHIETLIGHDRLRPILYVTAQSGSLTAIEAIKRGAYDYLSKPLDFDLLKQRIAEAVEYRQLTRLPVLVESKDDATQLSDVLVGRCRAMQEVYKGIGRLASLAAPVLIEGEVGTGKEMVARAIHEHGARAGQAFVKLSTTDSVEESLAEAIFGDAGSDAAPPNPAGGTLMIEEVGGLSSAFQSRLLRFFQEPNPGLRIILSTSTPARDLAQQGRLRGDLYYFLSPYLITVPSLRHRMDDLELLVAHFMQNIGFVSATRDADGPPRVSPAAMNLLKKFDWPGNVAQLKSVIQSVLLESRGAVLATDSLRRALSTGAISESPQSTSSIAVVEGCDAWDIAEFVRGELEQGTDQLYDKAVALLDRRLITLVLKHTQGNQAHAARLLGMTRTSLRRKIAATQVAPDDSGPLADQTVRTAT